MKTVKNRNPEIEKKQKLFLKRAGRTINKYGMISGGDRVAVAISGGKDSIALLEVLSLRRAHIPVDYEVMAVHVSVESVECGFNRERAEALCSELGVPFHYIEAPFPGDEKKSVCASCAIARRNALFRFCDRHSCNRLAFGHNLDDAAETLLMNMVFGSTISGISPSLNIFSGRLRIVRPLIQMTNSEIESYLVEKGMTPFTDKCIHWKNNNRETVRKILRELEETAPGAARRLFNSMSNIKDEYLI